MCVIVQLIGKSWLLSGLLWVLTVLQQSACATSSCRSDNPSQDPFADPCTYPYSVPTLHQVSLSPDGLVVRQNGSHISLTCSVQQVPPTSGVSSTMHTFSWEINGKIIRNDTGMLELVMSEKKEGVYRCIVGAEHNGQMATVVSNAVTLELPRMKKGPDQVEVLTNQSTIITRVLPVGGFTVLECQPRTNNPLPSNASVTWLRNNKGIVDGDPKHVRLDKWKLLVMDFALENGDRAAQYQCIVAGVQFFNEDLGKIYMLSTSPDIRQSSKIFPSNQRVVSGGTATFYCFIDYKQQSDVTWWKDNTVLTQSGRRLMNHHAGASLITWEELVVSNVSSEDGGVYSCRGASGEKDNATLMVVSTPIAYISGSQGGVVRIGYDIITQHRDVNLTCLPPSSGGTSNITYTWYIGGNLVPSNHPSLGMDGNTLALVGGTNGTVQCFASNEAGISSDAVIVLTQLRPPTNLTYNDSKKDGQFNVVYGISFNLPKIYFTPQNDVSVTIRVTSKRVRDPMVTRCTYSSDDTVPDNVNLSLDDSQATGAIDLPIQKDIVKQAIDSNMLVEVAVIVNGIASDFVALRAVDGSCKIPVHLTVIQQNFISEKSISYYSSHGNSWQLNFDWNAPLSANNDFLISTYTSLSCSGKAILDNLELHSASTRIQNVSVPSCAPCNWNVTYTSPEGASLTNSVTFVSKATAPSSPPDVISVSRAGSDGKTVQVAFTIPPQSCREDKLSVKYYTPSSNVGLSAELDLNSSSCSHSPNSALHSYSCDMVVGDKCWQNISLAYSNAGQDGVQGPYSTPYTTFSTTKNHLQVERLFVGDSTSSSVQLQIDYSQDLECFLRNNSTYKLKVCWGETSVVGRSCPYGAGENVSCTEVKNLDNHMIDIDGLTANTTYTYHALIAGANNTVCSPPNGLLWTTKLDTFTGKGSSRSDLTTNKMVIIAVSLLAVFAVLLILVIVGCIVRCIIRRKKKKNHHHNLTPLQENYRDDIDDPVDITRQDMSDTQSQATSIHRYDNNIIMRKFLDGPDGIEQEPSMGDEDYCFSQNGMEPRLDMDSDSSCTTEDKSSRRENKNASTNGSRRKLKKRKKRVKKSNEAPCSESSKLLGEQELEEEEEELLDSNLYTTRSSTSSYVIASGSTQTELSHAGNGLGYIQATPISHQQSGAQHIVPTLLQSSSTRSTSDTSGMTVYSEELFQPRSTGMAPVPAAMQGMPSPDSMETSLPNFPSFQYNQTPNQMRLVRTISGGHSNSSGYASQSMDSSAGLRIQDFEQQLHSGYVAHTTIAQGCIPSGPFSPCLGLTLNNSSRYPFSHGQELEESTIGELQQIDYARMAPDEQTILNNIPLQDDNGSLSSDSVFSESVSFTYSNAGPRRERQSEGYCSFPKDSTSPNEDKTFDYINVNPKHLADVQFNFSTFSN